jgi:myosin-crossreactive antigen
LAGVLAGAIGTRTTLFVGGGIATLAGACMLVPGVRDPDRAGDAPLAHAPVEAP